MKRNKKKEKSDSESHEATSVKITNLVKKVTRWYFMF